MPSLISYRALIARRVKLLFRSLWYIFSNYDECPKNLKNIWRSFKADGIHGIKLALISVAEGSLQKDWATYCSTYQSNVRSLLINKIKTNNLNIKISIIVPTYNTPELMLKQMLSSVENQIYPHWELCISDDSSTEPHVRKILTSAAKKDKRIKLLFNAENKGTSFASNRGLELATGDFIVFLDHDDFLHEQCLARVAQTVISDNPDFLYSDEALVSADGLQIIQISRRPAFSPEYLKRHPYIVHLIGFKPALLDEIGGFDESLKISQDYDLILRASEKSNIIVHIPEILYFWRTHSKSAGHQRLDEVMDTSLQLIKNHLARTQCPGTVTTDNHFNFFNVSHPIRFDSRIAIIIPTKNCVDLLKQCIDSINLTVQKISFDIIIIDHDSDDSKTKEYLASLPENIYVMKYKGIFNFSKMNNFAVSKLVKEYSYYLFCNNDIEAIESGWLNQMLQLCQLSGVGVVGPQLLYGDRSTVQHAGVCVGAFGAAEHYAKFLKVPFESTDFGYMGRFALSHEVSAVTAACMLIRREVFDEIGGFDEQLAVGFGDVDLCLRALRKGWRIMYCSKARLIHHESITRGKSIGLDPHPEDSKLFLSIWKDFLSNGDPYFNPGLSLTHTCWQSRKPIPVELSIIRRIYKKGKDGKQILSFSAT